MFNDQFVFKLLLIVLMPFAGKPFWQEKNMKNPIVLKNGSILPKEYSSISVYPYIAPIDYCREVNGKIREIRIGDSYEKVCEMLPPATELRHIFDYNHVYDPKHKYLPKGFALYFVFERKQSSGSVKERASIEYIISFDLNKRVTTISFYNQGKSSKWNCQR